MNPSNDHKKNSYLGFRKKLLINPNFQLKFMGFIFILILLALGTFYASQQYFFWKFRQIGIQIALPSNHVFFHFLANQKTTMNLIFIATSLVVFVLIGTFGLLFSHRIVGPLYRFHQHLLKTSESGKYSQIHFREKDFFQELADAYNKQLPKQ